MQTYFFNKKKREKILLLLFCIFFLYSCFKDRPRVQQVQINQDQIHYANPYILDKEQKNFELSFDIDAPKTLQQYSITIHDGVKHYHPNVKNVREEDGLQGRKTFFVEKNTGKIQVKYEGLNLEQGKYYGEILAKDAQGYQTRSTFILHVE